MIIYNISTDLWNFWDKYLSLYSAIQSKEKKLTPAEQNMMIEIIMFEGDPFRKEGRKTMMSKLKYSNSLYSLNLGKLRSKGLIKKKDKKLEITKVIRDLKNEIQTKSLKEIPITFKLKFDEE